MSYELFKVICKKHLAGDKCSNVFFPYESGNLKFYNSYFIIHIS